MNKKLTTIILLILLLILFFGIRSIWLENSLSDDLSVFYANPDYQTEMYLDNFLIYKQKFNNSCGQTTISMVKSYLEKPISESDFSRQAGIQEGKSGMLPAQFARYLQIGLESFKITHQKNIRDSVVLENIVQQLRKGRPVPVYFSTINDWDKPNYDTHYSAVVGVQPSNRTIRLANAYGYLETIPIPDFLLSLKYKNYQNPPLDFQIGLFFGIIDRNNLFIIE